MKTDPNRWIVGVTDGMLWLKSIRTDISDTNMWSRSLWDSLKFENKSDAVRAARRFGGKVYIFNPVTGSLEQCKPPEGEMCNGCQHYTPYDGVCHHPRSINYREFVSFVDACDEWEARMK